MGDPWDSPWATNSPAECDLPTAPQIAHSATDYRLQRRASPGLLPWSDGEAWAGWNDAGSLGNGTPGWGGIPDPKPLAGPDAARQPRPDLWRGLSLGGLETTKFGGVVLRGRRDSEASRHGRAVDSAISLGDDQRLRQEESLKYKAISLEPLMDLAVDAQDAWGTEEETPEALAEGTTPATSIQFEHSEPAEYSAGLVIDAGHDIVRNRPPPRVQTPVDVYGDHARRSASDAISSAGGKQPHLADEQLDEERAEILELQINGVPQIDQAEATSEVEKKSMSADSKATLKHEHQGQKAHTAEVECDESDEPISQVLESPSPSFAIDFAKLGDLFPSTEHIVVQPEPVPDVIIDDTFASCGERKAWYNISRFGSLRKHKSGDDEKYVRVSWTGSEVRERTIKTVRQWMEEDSTVGHVVLGKRVGGSGAAMFNWGSPAPPVEIGELLGRNGRHSRQRPLPVKLSPAVLPTAVSFGWTSGLPSSPAAARHPLATELEPTNAPPPKPTAQPFSGLHQRSGSLPSPLQPLDVTNASNGDEEDDDGWGDMVSSPTVESGMASLSGGGTGSGAIDLAILSPHNGMSNKLFDQMKSLPANGATFSDPVCNAQDLESLELTEGLPSSTPAQPTSPLLHTELLQPADTPLHIPRAANTANAAKTTTTTMAPAESWITRSGSNADDEEVAAGILRNLPDLAYMLR